MMYNDIRASLKFKDEWKISYRDTLEFAYTSLWSLHLKQDKVVEALCFADEGRAQALRDLMDSKYVSGEECYQSHSPETSACFPLSCVPSNTVFIAVDGKEIFFWVFQDGKDVQLRRKEITDSNEDVKTFIMSLRQLEQEVMLYAKIVHLMSLVANNWPTKGPMGMILMLYAHKDVL